MKVFLLFLLFISTLQAATDLLAETKIRERFGPQVATENGHMHNPYGGWKWQPDALPLAVTQVVEAQTVELPLNPSSPLLGHSTPIDSANEFLRQAAVISAPLTVDTRTDIQQANDLLAEAIQNNKNLAVCPDLYRRALEIFDSLGNTEGVISCRIGLGMNGQGIAHFDRAIELLLPFQSNPTRDNELARAYLGKANALRGNEGGHDNANALIAFAEAEKYARGRLQGIVRKNKDDCIAILREAAPKTSAKRMGRTSQKPVRDRGAELQQANHLLAEAKLNNGRHFICNPLYRQALELFQKHEDTIGMASCYTGLGMNHAGDGNFDLAINILRHLEQTPCVVNMWAQCQLGKANFLRSMRRDNVTALKELQEARQYATDPGLLDAIDRAIEGCRHHLA